MHYITHTGSLRNFLRTFLTLLPILLPCTLKFLPRTVFEADLALSTQTNTAAYLLSIRHSLTSLQYPVNMENMGLFARLPGEMRNAIYDLALTHGPDGQEASPALLTTCKQIHSEGQQLLYDNSTFYFDAAIDRGGILVAGDVNGYYNNKNDRVTLPIEVFLDHPGTVTFKTMSSLFPEGVARVRRFRLHVDISEKPNLLSSFLLHLNSFVRAEGCEIKEIELNIRDCNVDDDDVDDPLFYSRALYLITKLPRNIDLKLNLEGFDNKDLQETFLFFRQENHPKIADSLRFDLFKELQDLEPSVHANMALSLQADSRSDCLRAAGQQLLAIITRETNVEERLCELETYSWRVEQVFRKNIGLLKIIIEKLEQRPDRDEKYAFLIGCKALVDMRLTPAGLIRHLEGGRSSLSAFGLSEYP